MSMTECPRSIGNDKVALVGEVVHIEAQAPGGLIKAAGSKDDNGTTVTLMTTSDIPT